ncbi:MAG TPA: hypothetical protein PK728_12080 [Bacillota bacterium]|nr:hypothetical protein [Bacillota bacterium]
MKKSHCYITRKHGGIYIDTPYDEDFIEALKRHVPAEHRKWDPDMKTWWISDKYAAQAERDCKAHFENVMEC